MKERKTYKTDTQEVKTVRKQTKIKKRWRVEREKATQYIKQINKCVDTREVHEAVRG